MQRAETENDRMQSQQSLNDTNQIERERKKLAEKFRL